MTYTRYQVLWSLKNITVSSEPCRNEICVSSYALKKPHLSAFSHIYGAKVTCRSGQCVVCDIKYLLVTKHHKNSFFCLPQDLLHKH